MLHDRRKLRERLLATATFAAIGLATLGALDFLVTGGFDLGSRRTASTYGSPLIGASAPLVDAEPASTVTAVTWTDPEAIDEVEHTEEALLDAAAEPGETVTAPSEDQLNREIAELYLEDAPEDEAKTEEDAAAVEGDLSGGDDILYDARDLRPDPNAPDSE